jgi:hypothetical protein
VITLVLLGSSAVFAGAAPLPGDITLASTSDTGVKGNAPSFSTSLSADGTNVAFYSHSTNLDPADTDSEDDVYVKNLATGDIALASTSDAGTKGNGGSFAGPLSADGTKVAFSSFATNLDASDTDSIRDTYVKNLATGDITLASTSDAGIKANSGSSPGRLSADGSKVVFESSATNLDPADSDGLFDVYVKNLATGDVTLASTSDTGTKGNGNSSPGGGVSGDGAIVGVTSSSTNLDPADSDGLFDVYVKNLATGDVTLASTSDTGTKGNGTSFAGGVSGDGTKVAFLSFSTNLDPADTDSFGDYYVKDLATGDLALVSTSDAGVKANFGITGGGPLSADATKVAFISSSTNLDPADTDGLRDVYVKDLVTGDIMLVSTSDDGLKANNESLDAPTLSADGTKAAFRSLATNLDPADTDVGISDIYVKTLSVVDVTPPVITAPIDITVDATGPDGAVVNYSASATDDVDGPVPLTCSPPSGSTFPIGTTTVNCIASDASGNEGSASFNVHVKGASEQVADLIALVDSYNLRLLGTALHDKLVKVQEFLTANKPKRACERLDSFLAQVKEQRGKRISVDQADRLTMDARRIRAVIGC